ncbi:hypothetical protein ACTXT7_006155 [Hymenolepis weldensis]
MEHCIAELSDSVNQYTSQKDRCHGHCDESLATLDSKVHSKTYISLSDAQLAFHHSLHNLYSMWLMMPLTTFAPMDMEPLSVVLAVKIAGLCFRGGPEGMKLPSTGSIFLATGGTTSSSSQNSSLHKSPTVSGGMLETSGMETVNENHGPTIDPNLGGGDEDTLHEDDPNSVSPYASTSLIEQLRRGGGANLNFSEVIPPPPHYPPPPVPSDSPPPKHHNVYSPSECCHYAQSDLHQQKMIADEVNGGQIFMGAPQTSYLPASAAYPAPGQEQYWPPNGMCYVQQQSVVNTTMPSQSNPTYLLLLSIFCLCRKLKVLAGRFKH